MLGDAFSKFFSFLKNLFGWIGNLLRSLFQGLIDIITGFFAVIYALIDCLLYFIFNVGLVIVLLFKVFFAVGKLLFSILVGFKNTLASLTFTPTTTSNNGYSHVLSRLFEHSSNLQLNVIAYILLFLISFMWFIGAMKLISSMRVGGD